MIKTYTDDYMITNITVLGSLYYIMVASQNRATPI